MLQRMPIADGRKKLGKAGLDLKTMDEMFENGGARGLLAMLGLPVTFQQTGRKNCKPRATKNLKAITEMTLIAGSFSLHAIDVK